jgi:hypothetical protein
MLCGRKRDQNNNWHSPSNMWLHRIFWGNNVLSQDLSKMFLRKSPPNKGKQNKEVFEQRSSGNPVYSRCLLERLGKYLS